MQFNGEWGSLDLHIHMLKPYQCATPGENAFSDRSETMRVHLNMSQCHFFFFVFNPERCVKMWLVTPFNIPRYNVSPVEMGGGGRGRNLSGTVSL